MADPTSSKTGDENFMTTRWSMVVAAAGEDLNATSDALADLCQQYWQPLYRFVRRSGHQSADAQDLTQAFFERLIEKRFIQSADRERGRFRTFLLASMKNFILNDWKKATRQKRGGGKLRFLDFTEADKWVLDESTVADPDAEFDRDWAVGLLQQVLDRLKVEYSESDKTGLFESLSCYLSADSTQRPYATTAEATGLSAGQVKVYVHRLRARYRELLELEIANTVGSQDLVEDELRYLFAALNTSN